MYIPEMEQKIRKIFSFLDNCIWNGCSKSSVLQREYLSSAVNVLTKCPKISHITKRDIFQVSFPQSDKKYDKSAVM